MSSQETVKIRALKEFSSTRYGNIVRGRTYDVLPWLAERWIEIGSAEAVSPLPANKLAKAEKVSKKPEPIGKVETKVSGPSTLPRVTPKEAAPKVVGTVSTRTAAKKPAAPKVTTKKAGANGNSKPRGGKKSA